MATKSHAMLKHYLQFMKSGQGFEAVLQKVNIISAADGKCKAEFTVQPEHTNAFGFLHGSFSATLVDIISGIALLSHKVEGGGVSVALNLSYFKGAALGEEIEVDARTIRAGKTLGFLEVEIRNKKTGETLVKGSHTKYIG